MKFRKFLRSAMALILILASLLSMVPSVFGAEESDENKISINLSDIEDQFAESDDELDDEELTVSCPELDELLAMCEEEEDENGIPATRDVRNTNYVFLDFKVGSASRNFNWQVKTSSESDQYFAANRQGLIAGYFSGDDPRLYMPVENTDRGKERLGKYVIRSGDIIQVRIAETTANTYFTSGGTSTYNSYFTIATNATIGDEDPWKSCGSTTIKRTTSGQTLQWNVASGQVGNTLCNVRWDPIQPTDAQKGTFTTHTRIYVDYIYVGPKNKAPVSVQFFKEDGSGFGQGYGYVGYGQKAPAWDSEQGDTDATSTQTIWGWQVHQQIDGKWTDMEKLVMDPSTFTCNYNTRFYLTKVTIRKQTLSSTQSTSNGTSTKDDKYVLTIDGFDTAEVNTTRYGSALDIAILVDRSGSQAELASTKKCAAYSDLTAYLDTLDKSKWAGYYRASCWRRNNNKGGSGASAYVYHMPVRYYRGAWQMQVLSKDCDCNSTTHRDFGVVEWNSTGMKPCDHVDWVAIKTGFELFESLRNTQGYSDSSITFTIGPSRLGRTQNGIRTFLQSLYNSSPKLKPGASHKVSVIGFGKTVFMANYPYDNAAGTGTYKTSNNYSACTKTAVALDHTNYEAVLKAVYDTYVYGATRIDCAMQVLTGTKSAIESAASKDVTATKTDYLANAATGRKRVVIVLTDGSPSSNLDFDNNIANKALTAAKTLKSNTTIYTVGIMTGLDDTKYYQSGWTAGTNAQRANNFMNLLSSRYPSASAYNTPGTKVTGDYFFSDTSAGSDLTTKMTSVWNTTAPTLAASGKTGPGSLWLHEKFGREWKPDPSAPVKIWAAPYTGNGTYGAKVLIGQHQITSGATNQTINGNGYTLYVQAFDDQSFAYSLKWTDAKKSFLRETPLSLGSKATAISGSLDTSKGYKIYMEMPIEVDRNNTLGGNNIPLITKDSGCYQASSSADTAIGTKLYSYTIPNANVFCSVEADPHDYFISMEDYSALMNSTATNKLETILNGMIRMPDNLKPKNDNGLSNLDYVSFDVQLKAPNGTVMLRKAAALGGTSFTSNVNNVADSLVDLTKDQTFTMVSSMTFKNSSKDSFGREAYPNVNATYTPTYYVPKFAVVDYDGNISVDLGSVEGADASKITGISNGATFASGKLTCSIPSFMTGSNNTVSYTYNTKYAPSGTTSTSIARKVHLIPANVMTYDDSRIGFETGWSDSGTKSVLTQSFDNTKHHGYDDNYASTGNYHGSTKCATVNSKNSTAYGYFTFTGTGLEIVSRCSPDSGVLLAEIYSGTECIKDNLKQSVLCNTYLNTATYEQSPVIRWESDFDTYTVRLTAYYNVAFALQKSKDALTEEDVRAILGYDDSVNFTYIPSESVPERAIRSSYNVYVDAVRVFNSAGSSEIVKYAYSLAGEPVVAAFTDLRTQILDDGNWKGSAGTGMLYIADSKTTAGSGATTQDSVEGFPLMMDDTVNIEVVEVTGAYGTKEKRTYYLDSNNKRFKDPKTGKEIWSMNAATGGYYYYTENPTPTANKPYKTLSREYVRSVLGTEFIYYNSTYYSYGPKFEIYLSKNNGVAFSATGSKVYLSLRSVDGAACTVQAYNGSDWVPVVTNLTSKTEQFYDFSTYKGNVILRNTGSGILSIAQAKTIGAEKGVYVNKDVAFAAAKAFETPRDTVELGDLKLGHSLNLRSDISINYVISKDVLEQYDFYTFNCEVAGKSYDLKGEEKGNYIYFTLEGLNAAMMNDNVTAQLTAYAEDQAYVSPVDDYSIATYAFTMMNREDATEQFKRVCANLLRYGAATQTYLGYNTDALADEELTEEQRAYLRDLDTVTFGSNYTVGNDVADATVVWQGRTLSLTSTVTVKLVVNVSEYEGNAEDLELRVSYVAANGEEKTFTVAPQVYNADKGQYIFNLDQLNAADLRAVLTCQVFAGDVAVSQTLTYSADTYGNGKTGDLLTLCKALFAYVDEAKAFFG